jgi:hypothetical protein
VKLLAVAVFGGFALLGATLVYTDRHSNAESVDAVAVAKAYVQSRGGDVENFSFQHVSGPFVLSTNSADGVCALIDTSTQYAGDDGPDHFWGSYDKGDGAKCGRP